MLPALISTWWIVLRETCMADRQAAAPQLRCEPAATGSRRTGPIQHWSAVHPCATQDCSRGLSVGCCVSTPHAGWPKVIETTATVFFSYVGFDAVSNAAEEVRVQHQQIAAMLTVFAWPARHRGPNRTLVTSRICVRTTVCISWYIFSCLPCYSATECSGACLLLAPPPHIIGCLPYY